MVAVNLIELIDIWRDEFSSQFLEQLIDDILSIQLTDRAIIYQLKDDVLQKYFDDVKKLNSKNEVKND